MQSADQEDIAIQTEIHKTLLSINNIIMKIYGEMEMINELMKNGNEQYGNIATEVKEILIKTAEEQGLDVNGILSNAESETRLQFPEDYLNFITEKFRSCINKDL